MRRIIIIGSIVMVLALAGLVIGLTTRGSNGDQVPQKMETVRSGDLVIKINSSGNLESLLSVEYSLRPLVRLSGVVGNGIGRSTWNIQMQSLWKMAHLW